METCRHGYICVCTIDNQIKCLYIWDLIMKLEGAQYTQVLSPDAPVSPCCPDAVPDDIKISC